MQKKTGKALEYLRKRSEATLSELRELLEIPSISTQESASGDVEQAADWIARKLERMGAQNVGLLSKGGHPVVFGEVGEEGTAPTVLVYGHYDVQPPEPLEAWTMEPFKPRVRDGKLYARGATDMKGQLIAALAAVEAAQRSGIPLHAKFLFEGEEEIGSRSLPDVLREHRDIFAADFALNPDAGMIRADLPTITYALRGGALFQLEVFGPAQDVHSGLYGGAIRNPAHVLCEVLARLHEEDGRVSLPGFYDRVRELDEEERRQLAELPMDDDFYLDNTGSPALWGEPGYTPVERVGARPTLEINSLNAGYTGDGFKAIVPHAAKANLSTRLVPDQDPVEAYSQLRSFLEEAMPMDVRWELEYIVGVKPSIIDRESQVVQKLAAALEEEWGTTPVFQRVGGGIPVVSHLQDILGMPSVLTGFSLPDDNLHGPDEKLDLGVWRKGTAALVRFFGALTEN